MSEHVSELETQLSELQQKVTIVLVIYVTISLYFNTYINVIVLLILLSST
jgi:hypothetical protein